MKPADIRTKDDYVEYLIQTITEKDATIEQLLLHIKKLLSMVANGRST